MSLDCYVFFDVDDTLVQWNLSWEDAFVQVARAAGVERTHAQVTAALEWAFTEIYEDHLRRHPAEADLQEFWLDYDGAILAHLGVTENLRQRTAEVIDLLSRPDTIALFPETQEALSALTAAGARLGIVTERPQASPDLDRLGIGYHFDPVIDAFAARTLKHSGMFEIALETAAAAGLPAWHVGDRYPNDVLAARTAGLQPIFVDRHAAHPEPDCPCVRDLREILPIVANGAVR